MKHRFLFSFMFLLLFLWLVPQAIAAGTPAGTGITNQAYVDYNDANGNPLTRVFSNIVTTTVSQVAGVELLPADTTTTGTSTVTLGSTVNFQVDVNNTGNGSDVYDFTINAPTGDFVPSSVKFYHDADDSGTFTAGDTEIVPVGNVYTTGTIPADGTYPLVIEAVIPAGLADGDTSFSTGTIVSRFDNAVSTPGSFTINVASAAIGAVKTHLPASPAPGDTVTYTITLTNSGSKDGTTTVINDPIPSGLTYVPESITVGGVSKTDTNGDADGADFNATVLGAVYLNAGTIRGSDNAPPSGDTVVITFQATVNAAVAAGTSITNQATVNYDSQGLPVSQTTNGDTFSVASAPSVAVTPGTTSASGDPGDLITYAITIDNNGNTADVIDVSYTSSEGWTWDLWYDANGDGIAGSNGDFLLIDTDGDGIVDIGSIPQSGSAMILATTTIPTGSANGTVDTLVVTGTSSIDTGISDTTGNLATTVTASVLAITKTVNPATNQLPGATLTYTVTVTNNGSGVASAVVITDLIPTFTTYVAGSIKIGATPANLLLPAAVKTDAADGDGAQFDSGSNAIIAGGASKTLGAGGTFILQFQVTID